MTHGSDSMDSPVYGTFGNGSGRSPEPEPQYSLKMFGEVVKTFRKRARLTQEQFAPLAGYSPRPSPPSSRAVASRRRTSRSARTAFSTRSG